MKVLIVGIDGLDGLMVKDLVEYGKLPLFSWLADTGSVYVIDSPDATTGPAWTSIMCGMTSETHGVHDWWLTDINKPDRQKRLWEYLNERGISCAMFNVPMTFPPSINCNPYLVAGFPAPDDNSSLCFPAGISKVLDRHNYRMDTRDCDITSTNAVPEKFMEEVKQKVLADEIRQKSNIPFPEYLEKVKNHLDMQVDVFTELHENEPADVSFVQNTFFDRASHTQGVNDMGRAEALILLAERFISKLYTLVEPDLLFIISDHGIQTMFNAHEPRRIPCSTHWHKREAVFCAHGHGIVTTKEVKSMMKYTVVDFLPTLMHALNLSLPISPPFEGKVIYPIFDEGYSEEDKRKIEARLKELGYIE